MWNNNRDSCPVAIRILFLITEESCVSKLTMSTTGPDLLCRAHRQKLSQHP